MGKFSKLLFVATLIIAISGAYGAHNLLINGSTEAYVNYGQEVEVSLFTETPGNDIYFLIYIDCNSNGSIDPSEPLLSKNRDWDGSPYDEDEEANGIFTSNLDISSIGYMWGDYVIIAKDGGVADTAILHLMPISSSLFVSGTVIYPPNTSGITIFVAEPSDTAESEFAYENFFGTYTRSDGSFIINLPDEFYGDTFILFPIDIVGLLPDYVSPQLLTDTLVMTSPVSGLNLSFTDVDATHLYGNLIDNHGNPLPDIARIVFFGAAFTLFDTTYYGTSIWSTTGANYSRYLKSEWGSYWIVAADIGAMCPDYLIPYRSGVLFLGANSQQHDIIAYQADTYITGHVYVNGVPMDNVKLSALGYSGSDTLGSTFTQTYSDGHYSLFVSSEIDSYSVQVSYLPPGFTCEPAEQIVPPGAENIDFYITGPKAGDVNHDGEVDAVDLVYLANYVYNGGPPPDPEWLGDENCDGEINTMDVNYLANYLFSGGPEPVPCYPFKYSPKPKFVVFQRPKY